jgi:hypothetical protein
MESASKATSAELILKLYELRRDAAMREAREWYLTKFAPTSADDVLVLLRSSFEGSRYYRMVTTYWEMAAALVNHGGIDAAMFLDANSEHIGVYAKLEPFLTEVREKFRPGYLQHLETLVKTIPQFEQLTAARRTLLEGWAEASKKGNVGFRP